MHIGKKIKEVLIEEQQTVKWLAESIGCERTNAYKILERRTMNAFLLQRICLALKHDFFKDLSEEMHHM